MKNLLVALMLLTLPAMQAIAQEDHAPPAAGKPADGCAPDGDLKFICGVAGPEDLQLLPGGKWLVAGSGAQTQGLQLVNIAKKTAERWLPASIDAPAELYKACPAPVMDEMRAHGLSIRDRGQGRATLYVVNHAGAVMDLTAASGRETIEVFEVDTNGAKPSLTWAGCVALPSGLVANSVTSTPDGSIFLTVMIHPGMSIPDYMAGRVTGAVYHWRPGSRGFQRVWGTELIGNNGIEASADGKILYVAAKNSINVFSNTNPAQLIQKVTIADGSPDNIHWVDGKLVGTGIKLSTDPACADLAKAMSGMLGDKCLPGYFVVAMDPATYQLTPIASGGGSKSFAGVSTGLPVGKTLWLGSPLGDRIAYRPLP